MAIGNFMTDLTAGRSDRGWQLLARLTLVSLMCLADSATLMAASGVPSSVTVESERDCFRVGTYEAWVDGVKSINGSNREFSVDRFKERFSKSLYDDSKRSVSCRFFTYAVDGVSVQGFSAQPKDSGARKLPVIIYNRGGRAGVGEVNLAQMMEWIFPLVSEGFFVIGSQYRKEDEFGGKDVADVLALFDIIDQRESLDGNRIGMVGWSRGGIMTMLVAARSKRLKAVVLGGTPSDLLKGLKSRPDMEQVFMERIPNYATEKEAALNQRSPLFLLEETDPRLPILVLHGSADVQAPVTHALDFASNLHALGRTYKLVIYPNGNHGLMNFRREVQTELGSWFQRYLYDDQQQRNPASDR
jgi:dipeptidyl aminopeptidase/acylaminoacyl peptidase